MNEEFTESVIRRKLYRYFLKNTDDLITEKWRGWYIQVTKEKSEPQLFRREFDIARFGRITHGTYPSHWYEITLIGYEVKGYARTGKG